MLPINLSDMLFSKKGSNSRKKPKLALAVVFVVALAFLCLTGYFVVYLQPRLITGSLLEKAVEENIDTQFIGRFGVDDDDAWGNEIVIDREETKEFILVEARSAGPDGIMDSEDDLTRSKKDWNNAIRLGKWLGSNAKDTAVGIIDGVRGNEEERK
jgi:hypothetical protein